VFTGSKKDHSSEEKSCVCADMSANDEVERRAAALPINETDLSQSSTPSLAHRRLDPAIARTAS
jgi:hypothetical protein